MQSGVSPNKHLTKGVSLLESIKQHLKTYCKSPPTSTMYCGGSMAGSYINHHLAWRECSFITNLATSIKPHNYDGQGQE